MRKNYNLLILAFLLSFLAFDISCRKVDYNPNREKELNNSIEERFFNSHSSSNPLVQSLAGFIKNENNKYRFVQKTVKQVGYPYWDKAMIITGPSGWE